MDLYFERYDGTAATVEDFIGCFETAWRAIFPSSCAGTGRHAESHRSRRLRSKAKTYRLDIAQTLAPAPAQNVKLPMTMPLALGLVGSNGGDMPLTSSDASGEELASGSSSSKILRTVDRLPRRARAPDPVVPRGFSARVRVDDDLTEEDLLSLPARQRQF